MRSPVTPLVLLCMSPVAVSREDAKVPHMEVPERVVVHGDRSSVISKWMDDNNVSWADFIVELFHDVDVEPRKSSIFCLFCTLDDCHDCVLDCCSLQVRREGPHERRPLNRTSLYRMFSFEPPEVSPSCVSPQRALSPSSEDQPHLEVASSRAGDLRPL